MSNLLTLNYSCNPYLFKNHNNDDCLLYTYADTIIPRIYGNSTYNIKPYNIYLYNLINSSNYKINIPNYIENYGYMIMSFNPQIVILDTAIKLVFNATFAMDDFSPIQYYLCSLDSSDYSFTNLTNFEVLSLSYTGSFINNNEYLLVDKTNSSQDQLYVYNKINKTSTYWNTYNLTEIIRTINIFNSSSYIIGGKTADDSYVSYNTLNNDLIMKDNKLIYDCSLLDNLVAYTTINSSLFDTNHNMAISIDTIV